MKYITTRTLLLLLPLLMMLNACVREVTSPAIARHEKKYPDMSKKYVYQSIIRLANIKHDADFEKLIKDVHKVVLYMAPEGDSTYQIKDLNTDMMADGYEQLVNIRTAEAQRISLWVKESDTKARYIALVDADQDVIVEIDGQINLQYLTALNMADEKSLMNLLQGGF
jgi:uncharacterized Zn ribbon protein